MVPGRESSGGASTRPPALQREARGSAESEPGAIGLGLELTLPFRDVGDLADESRVALSDSQSEVRKAQSWLVWGKIWASAPQ